MNKEKSKYWDLHHVVVVVEDGAQRSDVRLCDINEDADVEVDGQSEPEQADSDEASAGTAAERRSSSAVQHSDTVQCSADGQPDWQERRHQTHVRHRLST